MFSRDFRRQGVFPLATNMQIYKKGDILDTMGTSPVQKGMPHRFTMAILGESTLPSMLLA